MSSTHAFSTISIFISLISFTFLPSVAQAETAANDNGIGADQATQLLADYNEWNVVTFGNADLKAESEGAVAVGGTLTFNGTNTTLHPGNDADGVSLLAQNLDLSHSDGTLQAMNGAIRIGNTSNVDALNKDSNGASVQVKVVKKGASYDSNPSIYGANDRDADAVSSPDLFAKLFKQNKAITLANSIDKAADDEALGVAASVEISGNNATIRLTKGRCNYWNVSSAQLAELDEIKFEGDTPSADTETYLIVSIDGEHVVFDTRLCGNRDPSAMLWVASDATSVDQTGDSLDGSVLAPQAHLNKTNANIQGTIVVASGKFAGSEQHHFPFRMPSPRLPENPAPEEPSEPETPTAPNQPNPEEPNAPDNPTPNEPETPDSPTPDTPKTPEPEEPTNPEAPQPIEPKTPKRVKKLASTGANTAITAALFACLAAAGIAGLLARAKAHLQ